MRSSVLLLGLAIGALPAAWPGSDVESRVQALEQRVDALELLHEPHPGATPVQAASAIVSVRLVRKEAKLEHPMLAYHNLVFDVEFRGTEQLGDRRIRDVKGTIYFDDAFGDEIIGATTTQRLGIAAGESATVTGLLIDHTTVELSRGWKRVLTTDAAELNLRFEVDKVIYADDG